MPALLLLLACRSAFAAPVVRAPEVPALPVAAAAAPLDDAALAAFVESRFPEERARRPDLFAQKMRKAAASDFAFYRGMPDLFYRLLAGSPEAGALNDSPEILLVGDGHAENVEIVESQGKPLPQFNDFDDAGRGPAGLDLARTMAGAAALGQTQAQRRQLAADARQAYLDGLDLSFSDWRKRAAAEAAVTGGPVAKRDWRRAGGKPLADRALAGKLFSLTGLDARKWAVFDRAGAGLSSIGVRRFLFAHLAKDHARELKELREAAIAVFTGKSVAAQGPRVEKAYAALRQEPVDLETFRGLGAEWLLRRREAKQRSLDLGRARSSARVLGGLLAQVHRAQAQPAELARAMRALEPDAAVRWLSGMGRLREGLSRLVASGRWDSR